MKRKTDALLYGTDLFGNPIETKTSTIGKRFIYPPFSVLSARDGFWQDRKRAWMALGIKSELGRGAAADGKDILFDKSQKGLNKIMAQKKQTASLQGGLAFNTTMDGYRKEGQEIDADAGYESGTSIFDPVLCELMYKWFCPVGGSILDPFAGGSVRGIVAAFLHRHYHGCELRPEQVEANRMQWDEIKPLYEPLSVAPVVYKDGIWYKKGYMTDNGLTESELSNVPLLSAHRFLVENPQAFDDLVQGMAGMHPQLSAVPAAVSLAETPVSGDCVWQLQGPELCRWECDDSQNIVSRIGGKHDFLFTCPPYADLEVYSDDERDISNMSYPDFLGIYRKIIAESVTLMEDDSFAAFIVGEVRGKNGIYYNFVGDTIQACQEAGLDYYNEMILMTAVGSLPIRITNQFNASRKIGKTHQNILVFVKGDPAVATYKCGRDEYGQAD